MPENKATSITIGIDHERVIMLFPHPIAMLAMTAEEARAMAYGLLERIATIEEKEEHASEMWH